MGWTNEKSVFDSQQEQKTFNFSTMSKLALGPIHPTIQWILGALSPGVKWLGHEAYYSSPSSAKIKNA
jgi:hypothetical protein